MFVVAGASGRTGSVVVERLLSQRQEVRVLTRDAARVEALRDFDNALNVCFLNAFLNDIAGAISMSEGLDAN